MQGIAFSCLAVHRTRLGRKEKGGKKGLEKEGKLVLMLGEGERWIFRKEVRAWNCS